MNDSMSSSMRLGELRWSEWKDIFCIQDGKPLGDIRKSFWTALKKTDIVGFHFHDRRHTFTSHLVMVGYDLNIVRELLGCKTI